MKPNLLKFLIPIIIVACFSSCTNSEDKFISLRNSAIINETGNGNALAWFDEQDTAKIPKTNWETPGQKDFWPAGLVIDLGKNYRISGIWIFDGPKTSFNGNEFEHSGGELKINTGAPFKWEFTAKYKVQNDNSWHFVHLQSDTRFIQFQKISTDNYKWENIGPFMSDLEIREIILFGHALEKKGDHIKAGTLVKNSQSGPLTLSIDSQKFNTPKQQFPMEQFMGVNNFSWSPQEYLSQIGFLREYHHWRQNGVRSVDSAISWRKTNRGENLDEFYMKNKNKICVDIHRHILEEGNGERRPDFEGPSENPESYDLISDFIFQYSARYGQKKLPENFLRPKEGEPTISGAGYISYIETWNEPDRWWGNDGEHFTPYQFSALLSATYDGNLGKMGPNRGGKTADSNMKMVLGGLSNLDTSYIAAMKFWSDYNRSGSFPADVISFHHYCNTSGGQGFGNNTKGISPEADNFKARMQRIVDWRNRNLPACEIWISEFGWDSSPDSPQSALGHKLFPDKISSDELQAIWVVRGYLAGASAGVDRMAMFMLNDETGTGLFKSCGLLNENNIPKISWYYLQTTINTLKGTFFREEISSGHPDVWIYRFSDPDDEKDIYVLWCPTSDGTVIKNYMFSLNEKVSNARLIRFQNNSNTGFSSTLRFTHNMTELQISETPIMIEIERKTNSNP